MSDQGELFASTEEGALSFLADILDAAELVFVKKLSNNDRDWAQQPNKHQAGVYIPPMQRDSGLFPPLEAKFREAGIPEIRETFFCTEWPQFGVTCADTRLVHYTSKGSETHLTRIPKPAFADLAPASFLLIARITSPAGTRWSCLTVDSTSDDALTLADTLNLAPDFSVGIFDPRACVALARDRIIDFAEQVIAAWFAGEIEQFAIDCATMPGTAELAGRARRKYLDEHSLDALDPFVIERPGDAIRELSRGVELELFREFQRREKAVALVRAIFGDTPHEFSARAMLRALIDNIGAVDRLMLSASQQRKSRAGYSFEHQIEAALLAGNIPFAKQVIMDARKRPDFVLPSLATFRKPTGTPGLILSAKTTLRERWKQVQREMGEGDLFLATVDETIAANAIEDMAAMGIILVVPEGLKTSKDTEYGRHGNVLSFHDFFRQQLARRMPGW